MTQQKQTKIGIALLGCGGRSSLTRFLFENSKQVELISLYDPDRNAAEERRDSLSSPDAKICASYDEALSVPGVDWAMVFSPNRFHKEHILAAFRAGKHVFTEKPLATGIDDCKEIFDASRTSGLQFATGFVLRYAPVYRKVKAMLDEGYVGKILSIDANENIRPEHGAYIMRNWRRDSQLSGPHILEKCCHDLDLLNWFTQSLPTRVASFGGRNFFTPENESFCERFKGFGPEGFSPFDSPWGGDPHMTPSPFTSDKDLVDNQVAILEYRNQIRVTFMATLSNAIPERRMYISGTEGTIIIELYSGTILCRRIDEEGVRTLTPTAADLHGGGDVVIMRSLLKTMFEGKAPECSGNEGLESSVVALSIDAAMRSGQTFDLEPVWNKLQR